MEEMESGDKWVGIDWWVMMGGGDDNMNHQHVEKRFLDEKDHGGEERIEDQAVIIRMRLGLLRKRDKRQRRTRTRKTTRPA
jgi:hypothetical protein